MNARKTPVADVGIIIGRFQVHELHEAHRDLVDTVRAAHDHVIVFVGLSPLRNTVNNPLDFAARQRMFQETYPDIEVRYVHDVFSDEVWSRTLDREIARWTKPYQTVMLYGSRDSFIGHYHGKYPTTELESDTFISGTEIRKRIGNQFTPTLPFRAGMISASLSRFVASHATVDIAILDIPNTRVLLVKKTDEPKYRFCGGFADPSSSSYEEDARREVMEETQVEVDVPKYVGSCTIDDWRYRGEPDKIKTLFFVANYTFGRPQGSDDVETAAWISFDTLFNDSFNAVMPEHVPLVKLLKAHLDTISL
jgi:bifunctional NMN adenylyltransferase/nudix hydrolase